MPMLAPRVTTDVWKTIKNFHTHRANEFEDQKRKALGLSPEEVMPPTAYKEYPKLVYSQDYFTATPETQGDYTQEVHSKDDEDQLVSDGWFASLSDAKKAHYSAKEKEKSEKAKK